jgi:membrane associated rhomboid family serine protease
VPRLPPVTLYLLWILTGAFVLQLVTGGGNAANSPLVDWLALWPVGSEGFGGGGFLPWQLVTYAALHGDFIHLFFNAFMVWMLGAMLESQWGTRRYIQFVLACVLAAGAVHLLFGLIGVFPAGPALGISGLAALARLTPGQARSWLTEQFYLQHKTTEWEPWAINEASLHDWRAVLEAGRAIGSFSSREWLGEVSAPTSVLITMRDRVVPVRRQVRLFESIRGAEAFRVDGDHDAVVANAERFVPTLLRAVHSVVERSAATTP